MINLKGKKVLVLGLGLHGGGVGVVRWLAKQGARVTVTDLRSRSVLRDSLKKLQRIRNIRYVFGKHRKHDILTAGLIIKNPGVPPSSPYLTLAQKHSIPITSDIGIFFALCPARIIAVTGTRGKSTAASLLYQLLRKKRNRVFLGGNIRRSVLELLPNIQRGDVVILELSSFQLHDLGYEQPRVMRGKPDSAVFTTIFRDHIDWHGSFGAYKKAKQNIFRYQGKENMLFIPAARPEISLFVRGARSKIIRASLPNMYRPIVDARLGAQQRVSAALAIAVARRFGVSAPLVRGVLQSFRGLPGRQELLNTKDGIHWINDTTATNPEAAIAALARFRKKSGKKKLIIIAGGYDKKLEYAEFARAITKYADSVVVLPGSASKKIRRELRSMKCGLKILTASSMKKAVEIARKNAQQGDWVLLSPGAASFGLFANEFDRGEQFVRSIKGLHALDKNKVLP